jgi:hypothetical protein
MSHLSESGGGKYMYFASILFFFFVFSRLLAMSLAFLPFRHSMLQASLHVAELMRFGKKSCKHTTHTRGIVVQCSVT